MGPLKRILFVDDESNVLDGLRVLLRKHRHSWHMEFALGGERALALLAEAAFDVVVTDLRMPRVDGLAVLKYVRDYHPHTMRVTLSGDPMRESALAVIPYAHQSLTKPCRLGELESVLTRGCLLGDLVADPEVRALVGRIGGLPPLPRTYARLVQVLDDEKACGADVAAVIASDIAVSAKVLQLANSSFFGSGRAVGTVAQAISLLGLETLKSLTLSTALFAADGLPPHVRVFAEELHEHSALIAGLASDLVEVADRRDAFAAGMMHDVGRLVLASTMPEEMDGYAGQMPRPCPDAQPASAARHAKIGGYLLGLWGLPPSVIDAVARHHDDVEQTTSPIVRAVAAAERIAEQVTDAPRPSAHDVDEMRRLVDEQTAGRDSQQPTREITL